MKEIGPLHFHEEIMLLAIRDEKGTFATEFVEQVVAGAVLAELLLEQRLAVGDTKKKLVDLKNRQSVGDPVIDECLAKIEGAKRRASLQTWVSRLAGIGRLRHKVAQQLCFRGILRNDEAKVLLLFTKQIYPEVNPKPEEEIVQRLKQAIFSDFEEVDSRTSVLISLAHSADLLKEPFGHKALKARKQRIEQIVAGEMIGAATKEVVAACRAAIAVAVMVPIIASTASH